MPNSWANIASFVAPNLSQMGIGQKLWSATRRASIATNIKIIDATIREDNVVGLKYYSGLGFINYAKILNWPLSDGTCVTRIRKRFNYQGQTR